MELDQLSDILLEKAVQKCEINFQNGSQFVWFPKGLKNILQSEKEKWQKELREKIINLSHICIGDRYCEFNKARNEILNLLKEK